MVTKIKIQSNKITCNIIIDTYDIKRHIYFVLISSFNQSYLQIILEYSLVKEICEILVKLKLRISHNSYWLNLSIRLSALTSIEDISVWLKDKRSRYYDVEIHLWILLLHILIFKSYLYRPFSNVFNKRFNEEFTTWVRSKHKSFSKINKNSYSVISKIMKRRKLINLLSVDLYSLILQIFYEVSFPNAILEVFDSDYILIRPIEYNFRGYTHLRQ